MKVFIKTESFAEFVARGGKVTKCSTKKAPKKGSTVKDLKEKASWDHVDMSALPAALKIAYGIK